MQAQEGLENGLARDSDGWSQIFARAVSTDLDFIDLRNDKVHAQVTDVSDSIGTNKLTQCLQFCMDKRQKIKQPSEHMKEWNRGTFTALSITRLKKAIHLVPQSASL